MDFHTQKDGDLILILINMWICCEDSSHFLDLVHCHENHAVPDLVTIGGKESEMLRLEKIVSGGQTGADQAALDVAIELGIPHGGWVPKGRKTEDGPLPAKYRLREMPTDSTPKRTEQNVIDADGTLIISHGELKEGSEYTREMAVKHGKPWIHIDADKQSTEAAVEMIRTWISGNDIELLNVAGPPASKDPQIYTATKRIMKAVMLSSYEDG